MTTTDPEPVVVARRPRGSGRETGWRDSPLIYLTPLAVLAVAPVLGLSSRHMNLAVIVLIWSIVGFGLYIPYSLAGQMTVAIITSFGAGAFVAGLAANGWDLDFVPATALGGIVAFVLGALLALPVLRTKGHYFVIVTFVMAQSATIAASNWGVTAGEAHSGLFLAKGIVIAGVEFRSTTSVFYLCLLVVAVVVLSTVLLQRSTLGERFAAIRENELLARSVGIRTSQLKVLALSMGSGVAGIGGGFYVFYMHQVDVSSFNANAAITLVLVLVFGGSRSVYGPIVGAAFVFYLPEIIGLDPIQQQIAFGVALAAVILVFPGGVMGAVKDLTRYSVNSVKQSERASSGTAGE